MKKVAILGSTGSIGVNTVDVILSHSDEFKVVGLSANSNIKLLSEQVAKIRPTISCVSSSDTIKDFKALIGKAGTKVVSGLEGLVEIATHPDVDIVVMAIMGSASLTPLCEAIKAKKQIALANKEALVSAGEIVIDAAKKNKAKIIPVDSEHSAIFQCLNGKPKSELKNIYLTGSGGPLRKLPHNSFDKLSPEEVTNHPTWRMGKKISVDSATLMNKGLEVIEAKWLFGTDLKKIEVLIHPESIIHSMVEFIDGSVLAQLSVPDMRLPIMYALGYPDRLVQKRSLRLDFKKVKNLTFEQPDMIRFPCLGLAYTAAKDAGTYPAVLNATNEEAVSSFLKGKIKFTKIPTIIEKILSKHKGIKGPELDDVLQADKWSREEAKALCFQ